MEKYIQVFCDYRMMFAALNDAQFGRLIRAAIDYKADETAPVFDDDNVLCAMWLVVKAQLDREHEKYLQRVQRNKSNIRKRWEAANAGNATDVANTTDTTDTTDTTGKTLYDSYEDKDKDEEKENDKDEDKHINPPPEAEEFMRLWNTTTDNKGSCLFSFTSGFDNYKAWTRLWAERPWSLEEMYRAFKNIADAVNSGLLERKYIPRHPDRLALDLGRYLEPVKAKTANKAASGFSVDLNDGGKAAIIARCLARH